MDRFSPVRFMSVFYGFLKLINFPPPLLGILGTGASPREGKHCPRAVCPNCHVLSRDSLGAEPGCPPFPCSRRPVSVLGRGVLSLVHDAPGTARQAPYGPPAPHCPRTQSHFLGGKEPGCLPRGTGVHLQCLCRTQDIDEASGSSQPPRSQSLQPKTMS